ncbi:hypothetical protein KI387_033488, partial [Taxus chinensis]
MPPLRQATSHVANLSAANPLDGEFPYINKNLENFTDVETEEVRKREARAEEEIRAQINEIKRLQAEANEREAVETA